MSEHHSATPEQARAKMAPFDWADPFLLEDQLTDEERMIRDTARAYCERIIGMAAGRVVFDGPPLTAVELNHHLGARGVATHTRCDAVAPMPALPTTAFGKVDKKAIVEQLRAD